VPVPGAMSVVSLDEDECLGYLEVPVTSVAMPLAEFGTQAVDALISRVNGGQEHDVLGPAPMTMVPRDSVGTVIR
jgi:DNA-binding LacI/PurR family transcriptional regulator